MYDRSSIPRLGYPPGHGPRRRHSGRSQTVAGRCGRGIETTNHELAEQEPMITTTSAGSALHTLRRSVLTPSAGVPSAGRGDAPADVADREPVRLDRRRRSAGVRGAGLNLRRLACTGCCLVAVGCGQIGAGKVKQTSTLAPRGPTPTSASQAVIEARPPSGPTGTAFQLRDANFQVGQQVAVEIDRPDGQVFKGQRHAVTPDRVVKASYRTSATDPVGTYGVKFSSQVHADIGHFEVTARAAPTSAAAKAQARKS